MEEDESKKSEDKIQSEIRKLFIGRLVTAAFTATTAILLFILAGVWLVVKPYIVHAVGGVPSGAVAAFDLSGKCPDGWDDFNDANGRFVVGVGAAEGLTPRAFREQGDAEKVVLGLKNMPLHQHDTGLEYRSEYGQGSLRPVGRAYETVTSVSGLTSPAGLENPEPISIIPPYIALSYCRKN